MPIIINFPFTVEQISNTQVEVKSLHGSPLVSVELDPQHVMSSIPEHVRVKAWQAASDAAAVAAVRELLHVTVE